MMETQAFLDALRHAAFTCMSKGEGRIVEIVSNALERGSEEDWTFIDVLNYIREEYYGRTPSGGRSGSAQTASGGTPYINVKNDAIAIVPNGKKVVITFEDKA